MIKLGSKVKDTITGFEGIAIARSEWLWGCVRIGVQPKEIKDGKPAEETWLDENRLEIVEDKTQEIETIKPPEQKVEQRRSGGPAREGKKIIEG